MSESDTIKSAPNEIIESQPECLTCEGLCCKTFSLPAGVKDPERKYDSRTDKWIKKEIILESKLSAGEKGYDFYKCSLLMSDGKCSDYINRPWACMNYPLGLIGASEERAKRSRCPLLDRLREEANNA